MTDKTKAALAEAFKESVHQHAKAGNNVRWGEAESNGVIADMVDALLSEDEAVAEGSDAIAPFIAKVVNPSAFAQVLEKLPADHPARIVRPKKGPRRSAWQG